MGRSTRREWRRIRELSVLVIAVATGSCGRAHSAPLDAPTTAPYLPGVTYLALGDSVVFGDNPTLSHADATQFVGYPKLIAQRTGLQEVNAACPGETSGSLISRFARDNGCWMTDPSNPQNRIHNRPLHMNYSTSQLDFAVDFLRANPQVSLVTIGIGGNDLLLVQKDCTGGLVPTPVCEVSALPQAVNQLQSNLDFIIGQLRQVYSGPIVLVNIYALSYSVLVDDFGISVANRNIADAVANSSDSALFLANPYDGFKDVALSSPSYKADSCSAGLLIPYVQGNSLCDQHPSALGQARLADAVMNVVPTLRTTN